MRVVVVTKEGMDYSRGVNEWLEEFARRTGRELEVLDPNSGEGEGFVRTYDILEYPAIVAISTEGAEVMRWSGAMLPTINEVSFYVVGDDAGGLNSVEENEQA